MDNVFRIECTVKAVSDVHAKGIFEVACGRLLYVREWSKLANCLLPLSEHRDLQGTAVSRAVKPEDYINVTCESFRPFGWMRVEYVSQLPEIQSSTDDEVVLLARPVETPFEADDRRSSSYAPTLMRVARRGLDVTASFVVDAGPFSSLFDRLGVYAVQWRSLIYGLLSDLTPVASVKKQPLTHAEAHSG